MLLKLLDDLREVLFEYECDENCPRYKECEGQNSCLLLDEIYDCKRKIQLIHDEVSELEDFR